MKSISVEVHEKNAENCSTARYDEGSINRDVKILIIGLPNTGKTLILASLREKLLEIGVPEENIQIDSLDCPFNQQKDVVTSLLKDEKIINKMKSYTYEIHEVHQRVRTRSY